jgi:hypothetical protein
MPVMLPNLDDRSYADLVEEARGLIVANAPSLTDHNPSDPVITLTELFAYFTEILLYRVNTVTDVNRRKFLRLLTGPDGPVPSDPAALDAEVQRTVLDLRRVDRAVTAEDYELLATIADGEGRVARALCVPERNLAASDTAIRDQPAPGHVSVVLVPFRDADLDDVRVVVASYLDARRLITARVHVVAARLVPLRVRVTIRLMPDALESQVRPRVVAALASFLDRITGGGDGTGWPLGRNVYVSEVYSLLDTLPGVDFIRRTLDTGSSNPLDEIVARDDSAGRAVRNSLGELVSMALDVDELVAYQVGQAVSDLVFEQPPPTI